MATKLSELADLLKSAKKPQEPIKPIVEAVVEEPKVVEPPAPVKEEPQHLPSVHLDMLQRELALMKKMVTELAQKPRHNPMIGMSSGGGSGSLIDIDRPVRTVTSNYTLTTRDWYVGVNHTVPVTITLPTAVKNGREYVIKDESGFAHLVPITIAGTIDGDTEGLELRIASASVTLLYNNGWRII